MSFGYRDRDWVDPDEEAVGKPDGCTCDQCGYFRANPDGGLGYCVHIDQWYDGGDTDECDDWYMS